MRHRVILSIGLFSLGLCTLVPGRLEGQETPKTSVSQEIVTMDNMRSLVPSLVALGWDDFFINQRNEIGLSASQIQHLLSLRVAFTAASEEMQQHLTEAKLAMYEELDRDQVSAREVEERVRWVSALQGELVVLRFRYLLQAINILDHKQHQLLAGSLHLPGPFQLPPPKDPQCLEPHTRLRGSFPEVQLQTAQSRDYLDEEWRRVELSRCSSQASVSVEALLGYERGREAAKKLMKLADKLRKLADSRRPLDKEAARKLVAEMQPEFWVMEWTSRKLLPDIARRSDKQFARLANRLRTELLADELDEINAEVNRGVLNTLALARTAHGLKKQADHWWRSLERVGQKLCLTPPAVLLLQ